MDTSLFARFGWLLLLVASMAQSVRAGEPPSLSNPPVRKEALASLPKGLKAGTLQISPDGKHFAGAMVHGDKWTVYVDGVESSEYDAVTDDSIHSSADSKRVRALGRRLDRLNMRIVRVWDGGTGSEGKTR